MKNELTIVNTNLITMDSREIAKLTSKRHDHVMRDIRNQLNDLGIGHSKFGGSYLSAQNKEMPCFKLPKDQVECLIMGYSVKLRMAVIKRLHELEELVLKPKVPATYKEALLALVKAEEEREKQQLEIACKDQQLLELQPKVNYYDLILNSKSLVTITQIAKDYGLSGVKMNKILHDLKVQYKQSGQWLLYNNHADKGYTSSETIKYVNSKGLSTVKMNTKWTQAGRLFLYDLLKANSILPAIEN